MIDQEHLERQAMQLLHLAAYPPTATDPHPGIVMSGEPNELTRMVAAEGYIEVEIHRAPNVEAHHRIRITPLGLARFFMHHPVRRAAAAATTVQQPASEAP